MQGETVVDVTVERIKTTKKDGMIDYVKYHRGYSSFILPGLPVL